MFKENYNSLKKLRQLWVIPCEINKYLEKWLHHHLRLTKKKLL